MGMELLYGDGAGIIVKWMRIGWDEKKVTGSTVGMELISTTVSLFCPGPWRVRARERQKGGLNEARLGPS